MEKIGYILLLIVAVCWLIAMLVGMITIFPFGIIGLVTIIGIGNLFFQSRVFSFQFSNLLLIELFLFRCQLLSSKHLQWLL